MTSRRPPDIATKRERDALQRLQDRPKLKLDYRPPGVTSSIADARLSHWRQQRLTHLNTRLQPASQTLKNDSGLARR